MTLDWCQTIPGGRATLKVLPATAMAMIDARLGMVQGWALGLRRGKVLQEKEEPSTRTVPTRWERLRLMKSG